MFIFAFLVSLAFAKFPECQNTITYQGHANAHMCHRELRHEQHYINEYCNQFGKHRFGGYSETVCRSGLNTGCSGSYSHSHGPHSSDCKEECFCSTTFMCVGIINELVNKQCDLVFTCNEPETTEDTRGYTNTNYTFTTITSNDTINVWSRCPLGTVFDPEAPSCCSCGPEPEEIPECMVAECHPYHNGTWAWQMFPACQPKRMPQGCQCVPGNNRCIWDCDDLPNVGCECAGSEGCECEHHHYVNSGGVNTVSKNSEVHQNFFDKLERIIRSLDPRDLFEELVQFSKTEFDEFLNTDQRYIMCSSDIARLQEVLPAYIKVFRYSKADGECLKLTGVKSDAYFLGCLEGSTYSGQNVQGITQSGSTLLTTCIKRKWWNWLF